MTVYAVFKGYEQNIGIQDKYKEDEWLHSIYLDKFGARNALKQFGEDHWFDDSTETCISRYYQKGTGLWDHGDEMLCSITGGTREWMRYAPFEAKE